MVIFLQFLMVAIWCVLSHGNPIEETNPILGTLNFTETSGQLEKNFGRDLRKDFMLDKNHITLDSGAVGAYPKVVMASLRAFQERAEKNMGLWIRRDSRKELDKVRSKLATFVKAAAEDIVVVPNTTTGINAILRSIAWKTGDRILHFSTVFSSVRKIIQYIVDSNEGKVSLVEFPVEYPIENSVILANLKTFLKTVGKIRIAIIDHISSTPAVIVPIEKIIPMFKSLGIEVLVDGAHAIGHIPIDIKTLGPDYYVTSANKWLFTARGLGVMYVDKKHQGSIHPAVIASNYENPTAYQNEFYFIGIIDYCGFMTVTAALQFRKKLGGEKSISEYNHNLAVKGGAVMAKILGTRILQSNEQIGNMVDVQLPLKNPDDPKLAQPFWNNLLLDRTNIKVTIYKHGGQWWARASAQVFTDLTDFQKVAEILKQLTDEINSGKI